MGLREFTQNHFLPLWDQSGTKVITVTESAYPGLVLLYLFELQPRTGAWREVGRYKPNLKVAGVQKILRYNLQHRDRSIRFEANRIVAALHTDSDYTVFVPPEAR